MICTSVSMKRWQLRKETWYERKIVYVWTVTWWEYRHCPGERHTVQQFPNHSNWIRTAKNCKRRDWAGHNQFEIEYIKTQFFLAKNRRGIMRINCSITSSKLVENWLNTYVIFQRFGVQPLQFFSFYLFLSQFLPYLGEKISKFREHLGLQAYQVGSVLNQS